MTLASPPKRVVVVAKMLDPPNSVAAFVNHMVIIEKHEAIIEERPPQEMADDVEAHRTPSPHTHGRDRGRSGEQDSEK